MPEMENSLHLATRSDVKLNTILLHTFAERLEEKATPVCRRCAVPSISHKQAGLRNSTWRGAHPAPHCGTRT